MIALVTGGASSGKSAFAESLAQQLPGPHAYAATMRHGDAETERRIARHRAQRAAWAPATVELAPTSGDPCDQTTVAQQLAQARTVLLEDLGNLVANDLERHLPDVLACPNVVVVGNEVGADGVRYDGYTQEYLRRLGELSCELAARADVVVEVVAGVPHVVKGELPWPC